MLDNAHALWYTIHMKHAVSFLLGVICAVWLFPPTPTVSLESIDRERIIYEVLSKIEEEGYSITEAKRSLTDTKKSWF